MFFTPKFGALIIHPLHTGSGETTSTFCTKGKMNSKKDALCGFSQTAPTVTTSSGNKYFRSTLDS